ncbi:hypothetical protein K7W03_20420 [Sphingobium sp. PNB]|uniref:hypothetical protein n=1 Tax=Sphingobium sp. PNB TaxID=863934 RepID=UPI001CA415FD|nr:hypothetical protein [Sphingobium sp. PNB]MCB4861960.1 hypothetical protein [Sphingobium sp. PNB]
MEISSLRKYNTFLAIHFDDWEEATKAKVGRYNCVIAIAKDRSSIRIARYFETAERYLLSKDEKIDISNMATAEVVIPEHQETVTRTDKVPVAVKQNRSPVARTLVGAVLLGPVGAVAGAASGLGGKTIVEYHGMERQETITVKDAPRFILMLKGGEKITIDFERPQSAGEWHHRLTNL